MTSQKPSFALAMPLIGVLGLPFACQSAPTPSETAVGTGGNAMEPSGAGGASSGGTGGSAGGGTGGGQGQTDASPGDSAPPSVAGTRPLTANDVSVLFPRFGNEALAKLWRPNLVGKGGPFLAVSEIERIVKQVGSKNLLGPLETGTAAQDFERLRVIAVRFDPCFAGTPCQAQIRLVLQGFMANGDAFDGGVHLLFNLDQNEFREVVTALRAMTALAPENRPGLPLSPSPALEAQGMEGPYGKALRALVTRHAGAAKLARLTFMNRSGSATANWEFGGFDYVAGGARPMAIPGLPPNTPVQSVRAIIGAWGYALHPQPVRLAPIGPVLNSTEANKATPAAIDEGYATLVSVSNPLRENPEGADCGSCHVAGHLRGQVARSFKVAPPTTGYANESQAPRIVGAAEDDRDNLRAFGYFDGRQRSVAISQRVANETHRVLQLLEQP
ncbi:MAG TPA: hypothetical protein VGG33_21860 [Polyangia bacterium]